MLFVVRSSNVCGSVLIPTGYGLDGPRIESQWPSCLRRGSATDHLLGLRVRIPAWGMVVACCK